MLYVSIDITPFIEKGEVNVRFYKSIKQSYMPKHYQARQKKPVLLLILDDI